MIKPPAMNDNPLQITLGSALATARQSLALAEPPAHVQAQLLAAFERGAVATKPLLQASRWASWWRYLALSSGGMGTAFAAFMAWALLTPYSMLPSEPNQVVAVSVATNSNTQFVALASNASIEAEKQAWPSAWVLPGEVSGNQLAELGLPFDPARVAEPQRAELLVASSGAVLGVRLAN